MLDNRPLNDPSLLREAEKKADKIRATRAKEKEKIDPVLVKQFSKMEKDPMNFIKQEFLGGTDLKFQESLYRYMKLILLAKK